MYVKSYLQQAAVAAFLSLQGRRLGIAGGQSKGGCCLQSSFRYVKERKGKNQLPKVLDKDHCEVSGYKSPAEPCLPIVSGTRKERQASLFDLNNQFLMHRKTNKQCPQALTFLMLSLIVDQS